MSIAVVFQRGRVLMWLVLAVGGLLLSGCDEFRSSDPLVGYASRCNVDAVQRELDRGGDPNRVDYAGSSPLFYAAAHRGSRCLETLVVMHEAGADVTRIEKGDSIFAAIAFGQDDLRIADWLLANGADPCIPLSEDRRQRYNVDSIPELARSQGSIVMADHLEGIMADCAP